MYGFSVGNENVYMTTTGKHGEEDEIPFSDLDANAPPPDYDDTINRVGVASPFFYADDESIAEETGPDFKEEAFGSDDVDIKEDLGNVFTNMDGVDTLF